MITDCVLKFLKQAGSPISFDELVREMAGNEVLMTSEQVRSWEAVARQVLDSLVASHHVVALFDANEPTTTYAIVV